MPHLRTLYISCRKATGDLVCSSGSSPEHVHAGIGLRTPDAGLRLQGRDILDVRAGCSAFPVKASSEHKIALFFMPHNIYSRIVAGCLCLNKICHQVLRVTYLIGSLRLIERSGVPLQGGQVGWLSGEPFSIASL